MFRGYLCLMDQAEGKWWWVRFESFPRCYDLHKRKMENVFSLGEEDNEAKKQRNKLLILLDLPRWKWKKMQGFLGIRGCWALFWTRGRRSILLRTEAWLRLGKQRKGLISLQTSPGAGLSRSPGWARLLHTPQTALLSASECWGLSLSPR